MPLNFPQLGFSPEAFLQGQIAKNQNQRNLFQDMGTLGQGIGDVGTAIKKHQDKQKWESTIDQLMQDLSIPQEYKQFAPILKQAGPDQGMNLIGKIAPHLLGQKKVNPIDEALKQKRLEILQQILSHYGEPKPVNPAASAAIDVRTQIANAANRPWYQKLFGKAPVITNPLKKSSGDVSALSDEELMKIINEEDQ